MSLDGDCRGYEPCFTSLQEAVDSARDGTTVWVYPGRYAPAGEQVLEVREALVCVRSVAGPAATVLDGEGRTSVVRVRSDDGALWLEGFTVTGAGNTAVREGFAVDVGGWDSLRSWIVGNVFEGNVQGAGVIWFDTAHAMLQGDIYIAGNVVRWNRGQPGRPVAAVLLDAGPVEGHVRVENNVIVDNELPGLGIGYDRADNPMRVVEVINNTIVGNTTGLEATLGGIVVHNNVVFGNEVDVPRLSELRSRSVRNNWFGIARGFVGVDGNHAGDPGFVDAVGGDYRLAPDSDARHEGTAEAAPRFDIDGRERHATTPDVGAYESSAE